MLNFEFLILNGNVIKTRDGLGTHDSRLIIHDKELNPELEAMVTHKLLITLRK
jgi:hypothetical protein